MIERHPPRRLTVLLDIPTPQRAPLLDRIAVDTDVLAIYLYSGDQGRGWGPVSFSHSHVPLTSGVGALRTTLRHVWQRRDGVFWCSGYDHPVKIAAMIFARLARAELVMRSDSSVDRERRHSRCRRTAKRGFLQVAIGRSTRVWTVGQRNDQYWQFYGFANRHRIPYTVPRPPGAGSAAVEEPALAAVRASGAFVFLFVGRLNQDQKGLLDLLAAAQRLPKTGRDWRLVVVGDGPARPDAERAAAKDRRLLVLGARPQDAVGPWYDVAGAVVVPSHHEAWGLVVNEARLAGCYVIASDAVGAAHDLLSEPGTGVVYPRGDVQALAQHLASALKVVHGRPPALVEVDAAEMVLAELRQPRLR